MISRESSINMNTNITEEVELKRSLSNTQIGSASISVPMIGRDGVGLEYDWKDTSLGVKRDDEQDFVYQDLKGEKGAGVVDKPDRNYLKIVPYEGVSINKQDCFILGGFLNIYVEASRTDGGSFNAYDDNLIGHFGNGITPLKNSASVSITGISNHNNHGISGSGLIEETYEGETEQHIHASVSSSCTDIVITGVIMLERGLVGVYGIDGRDGRDGVDGKNGINGTNGADGRNGIDGKNGRDGLNGIDGKDGQNGLDGRDGQDGIGLAYDWKGTELGIKRTNESKYEYVNLKGATGATGAAGRDGRDGLNGKDGRDADESKMVKYGDIIQQTNLFGGKKLYISSLDNCLARANLKWNCKAEIFNADTGESIRVVSTAPFFDGNYESHADAGEGEKLVLTIDFGGAFSGYPYGNIILGWYHTAKPKKCSMRVHSLRDLTKGWHDLTVTLENNYIKAYNGFYGIDKIEVTVWGQNNEPTGTGTYTKTWLNEMELALGRQASQHFCHYTQYNDNHMYTRFVQHGNFINNDFNADKLDGKHAEDFYLKTDFAISNYAPKAHNHTWNDITGKPSIKNMWTGTQAQYDAIANKDANTLYFITE